MPTMVVTQFDMTVLAGHPHPNDINAPPQNMY